ncbi:aminotransferase class V-fold PLP-dependent enzyme [Fictibacillus sp. BK138]|uniref:aminotransferase class V-fold PLP-dependent enzyme n=1 Tax=Fictibacillus sp. BK138 TaxID=2512121 RepID=UPI001028AAB5|nr:aminotransferase class V-fold PLP-dependent enzyme [Fictibacillus sp. BK138]RZT20974.1 cysteine desulfurase family protein [Fictibacillus sp. BK138]
MSIIYFDHAATSYPKPKGVIEAVGQAVNLGNPGRGGHFLSKEASRVVTDARDEIASFFGCESAKSVIFTKSATEAVNLVLKGYPWQTGDHIIASGFEHNAVYRTLHFLEKTLGISVTYLQGDEALHKENIISNIKENTRLLVCTHGSNVDGTLLPADIWGGVSKEYKLKLLVDAAQTAGVHPIHMEDDHIDYLAVPGHKGLLGPQGIGMLLINNKETLLSPLIYGGTGTFSELPDQPEELPYRLESGTLNVSGIAGVHAGVKEVIDRGLKNIQKHEEEILFDFLKQIESIPEVSITKPASFPDRLPVISLRVKGLDVHEIAVILDEHYNIAVRAGLHCAPLAHSRTGRNNEGALRISFGYTTTKDEVNTLIRALKEIINGLLG